MNRSEAASAMFFTPIIPTITLASQLAVEYGTLTTRRSALAHLVVRGASMVFVYGGYWYLNRLGVRRYLDYYLLTSAYLAACVYLFGESPAQKVFLYFTVWSYSTFVSSLCAWAAAWATGGGGRELPLRYALYAGAHIALVPLYLRFARARVRETLDLFDEGRPAYALYPVMAFTLFTALFGPATGSGSTERFAVMLLFEAFVSLVYYLLFSHFRAIYGKARAEEGLRASERQAALQRRYYEEVEAGVRRQQGLLHDARHHLVAIAGMQAAGDQDAARRYVQKRLEAADAEPRRYCANYAVNAVVGAYLGMAAAEGVAVSTELDLPESIGIDDYDLCSVFGNAIENALEACRRVPAGSEAGSRRFIDVKSRFEKGRLILRVANSSSGDLVREADSFKSSKGSAGGMGIGSMRRVVERYDGCLDCDPGAGAFTVSAVLYARGELR